MATIRRFSGRASWLSLAAFGLSGCFATLPQISAAASQQSPVTEISPNYYAPADSVSHKSVRSATTKRKTAGRSSKSAGSRTKGSTARSGQTLPAPNHTNYTSSSDLNYYAQASAGHAEYSAGQHSEQARAPQYYEYAAPAHPSQQTANYQHHSHQHQSHQQQPGFFGRVFRKSEAAVKHAGTNVGASVKHLGRGIYPSKESGSVQTGSASWYGGKFHGGKTASGERYDMESMTAAHRTLPFGTIVKVKNLHNGRECVVRINNRGPFIKGRIIDMSKAAAGELGFIGRGICKVQMQVLGRSE